jgi:hypothetical protein
MAIYRLYRNIEASYVEFIEASLSTATPPWTGITVGKGFPQDYKGKVPFIGVEVLENRPQKLEVGSKTSIKNITVKIRIIASDDGQRLDLANWLEDLLEDNDINYYSYTITNGVVSGKVLTGKIVIRDWFDNRKELTNTENLEKEDKYRHLFSFEVNVAI